MTASARHPQPPITPQIPSKGRGSQPFLMTPSSPSRPPKSPPRVGGSPSSPVTPSPGDSQSPQHPPNLTKGRSAPSGLPPNPQQGPGVSVPAHHTILRPLTTPQNPPRPGGLNPPHDTLTQGPAEPLSTPTPRQGLGVPSARAPQGPLMAPEPPHGPQPPQNPLGTPIPAPPGLPVCVGRVPGPGCRGAVGGRPPRAHTSRMRGPLCAPPAQSAAPPPSTALTRCSGAYSSPLMARSCPPSLTCPRTLKP